MKYVSLFLPAALLFVGGAGAQSTMTPGPGPSPSPSPSPMTGAPATTPQSGTASYTDDELRSFAFAAIEADKVQQDSTLSASDKQTKMRSAVQSHGLDADRFNTIARAVQADPALKKRVEQLASASPTAAPAATPSAAPTPGGND